MVRLDSTPDQFVFDDILYIIVFDWTIEFDKAVVVSFTAARPGRGRDSLPLTL